MRSYPVCPIYTRRRSRLVLLCVTAQSPQRRANSRLTRLTGRCVKSLGALLSTARWQRLSRPNCQVAQLILGRRETRRGRVASAYGALGATPIRREAALCVVMEAKAAEAAKAHSFSCGFGPTFTNPAVSKSWRISPGCGEYGLRCVNVLTLTYSGSGNCQVRGSQCPGVRETRRQAAGFPIRPPTPNDRSLKHHPESTLTQRERSGAGQRWA